MHIQLTSSPNQRLPYGMWRAAAEAVLQGGQVTGAGSKPNELVLRVMDQTGQSLLIEANMHEYRGAHKRVAKFFGASSALTQHISPTAIEALLTPETRAVAREVILGGAEVIAFQGGYGGSVQGHDLPSVCYRTRDGQEHTAEISPLAPVIAVMAVRSTIKLNRN